MRKKPLAHDAFVKKLNRQMQKHPNYRKGMRVTKVNGSLIELMPPESVDPNNPQEMQRFREDMGLLRVLWDSLSVVKRKYYCANDYVRSKMLPRSLLFRMSREGRCSMRLQSTLHSLYHAIVAHQRSHGSWPTDVTELIQTHRLMDPWRAGEFLQVKYEAPKNGTGDIHPQGVLAEYVRDGKRKFVLYADGRQETWKL